MGSTRKTSLRVAVAQRDGGRCVDCPPGHIPHPFGEWEADHEVPLACGGTDTLDNLATRCIPHHREKTARDGSRRGGRPGPAKVMTAVRLSDAGIAWLDAEAERRGLLTESGKPNRSAMIRLCLRYAQGRMPRDWNIA